jgi:muramoyltetrapeptide carboxypeptidase
VGVPALTRPQRLRVGDRVAVVSPSGPVPKDRLDAGCAMVRSWGLDVVVAPHVLDVHDRFAYLAGSDADRAGDLQEAWLDPSVAAVFCARGGYGVQRILDRLDWSAMRRVAPKVLAGYSDITALHEAFATQLGVATLHAPMVGTHVFVTDERTAEQLRRTLFEPESVQALTSSTAHTLVPGVAHGVTLGGCLGLLAAEVGMATGRPGAAGGILLLEDVDEKAYRIDGFLTQLLRAGWLDDVAGVALGSWKNCDPVEEVLLDRLSGLGVPVVSELGFGHADSSLTVPLGLPATLDANAAMLTVDVPALV